MFFFFSSRRRHTRCLSDWSSDVCSSDLTPSRSSRNCGSPPPAEANRSSSKICSVFVYEKYWPLPSRAAKIGRASCREGGEVSVGAGSSNAKESGYDDQDRSVLEAARHHR